MKQHNKITLICIAIFFFASVFVGCQYPTSSIVQNNHGNGGVTIGDDGTVTITSRNVIYIGEESETVASTTYLVKKYAELTIEDCPYFYIYITNFII